MGYRIRIEKSVAHEAHKLAGHPKATKHLVGGGVGTALAVSTASGVGTYQINRKLAKAQGDIAPPISATTGTTPTVNVVDVAKARKKKKGGK